ncbi:MAG: hypothetical protein LBQ07_01515 [Endomicrobium sp.]|jgi:cell division protein FtsB|nr:hypothetical protein [Endomicrobium sp.]
MISLLKIKIRYIIFIIILLFLAVNKSNRILIRRFFEAKKLELSIKNIKYQNNLLKQRIYYIENEPLYLEKIIRRELDVVANGEIEYKFLLKKN